MMLQALARHAWLACPDCPPARQARRQFFQLELLHNLVIAISPFIVTLALVLLIVRWSSAPRPRRTNGTAKRTPEGTGDASDV